MAIFQLTPRTPAGERFHEAAGGLIDTFREQADDADRDAKVCAGNFKALQDCGIAAAFVPEALGGFGLTSVHDWLTGIATLARGDGSTAIAINMHLGVSRGMASAYSGKPEDRAAIPLRAIAEGKMLICATATERGTDNLHPMTTATPHDEGWCINGHKMFVTMSPVATHLAMNLRLQDDEGDHLATTLLPIDTPGVTPKGDWDALGMRASGSQSIAFDNVKLPPGSVRKLAPWGVWSTTTLINRALGNLALVGAYYGIAEHACEIALRSLDSQMRIGKPVKRSPGVQQTVGEMQIELTKCRGVLQQTGADVDAWLAHAQQHPPSIEQAHELMSAYQAAKWVVNRGAIDIVNKAMDACGGGAFMSANPLTRLYRDVRAGPFMQPHAATEIRSYVGQVALKEYPER